MKNLLYILTGFFYGTMCFGQIEQYNYVGVQTFESGDFTSYHLDFEFFGNLVQGRVFVDLGGPNESLYYIKGIYKEQANLFQFKASYLVWTKSNVMQKHDCILNFLGTVKNLKTVKAFSGPYTSKKTSGESCFQGLLILSRVFKETPESKIEEIITTTHKETVATKPTAQPEPIAEVIKPTPTIPKKLESTPIKKDENLNVFIKNNTAILYVYDSGKVDDDRITISVNGRIVLEDYSIKREKKELEINLYDGKSLIEVTALNEGTKPPNTVKVEIRDRNNLIATTTSLKKGEKASLTLINE